MIIEVPKEFLSDGHHKPERLFINTAKTYCIRADSLNTVQIMGEGFTAYLYCKKDGRDSLITWLLEQINKDK